MTGISHIHGFCHPILCSLDPSSCDLWRQAPILFVVPFPFLSALRPLAMLHYRFLSNPGFPVLSLRCSSGSSHLSTCALSQTCVPPSSCSTSLHLISPSFNSKNIQLHYIYPCPFLHASVSCFPFQTFPLLADFLAVLHKALASAPKASLRSPHFQSPALSTIAQHELLYCWAVN